MPRNRFQKHCIEIFFYSHLSLRLRRPLFALFDSGTVRGIAVFRVAGILHLQIAGNVRAFAAMHKPFFLTAHGNRTFPVKRMPVRCDASAAVTFLYKRTAVAFQAASCIYHNPFPFSCCFSTLFYRYRLKMSIQKPQRRMCLQRAEKSAILLNKAVKL